MIIFDHVDKNNDDLKNEIQLLFSDYSKIIINIKNNDIDFIQPTAQKLKFTVKDEYGNEPADEIMVALIILDKELIKIEEIKDQNLSEIES